MIKQIDYDNIKQKVEEQIERLKDFRYNLGKSGGSDDNYCENFTKGALFVLKLLESVPEHKECVVEKEVRRIEQ